SLVGVIEPTLMSQRPFQLPAVIAFQFGVCQSMPTPRRLAISVATSMSNPTYSPVFSSNDDCGGYFGSVDTVMVPLSQMAASRSPDASVLPQTPLASDDPPEPDEPVSALPHAASGRARSAASTTRPRVLCISSPRVLGFSERFRGQDSTKRW